MVLEFLKAVKLAGLGSIENNGILSIFKKLDSDKKGKLSYSQALSAITAIKYMSGNIKKNK